MTNAIVWIAIAIFVGIYSGRKRKVGAGAAVLICICTSPVIGYCFISNSPYLDETKNNKMSIRTLLYSTILLGIVVLLATVGSIITLLKQDSSGYEYYGIAVIYLLFLVTFLNFYLMLKRRKNAIRNGEYKNIHLDQH